MGSAKIEKTADRFTESKNETSDDDDADHDNEHNRGASVHVFLLTENVVSHEIETAFEVDHTQFGSVQVTLPCLHCKEFRFFRVIETD
jgi:hypothetical protein